MPRPLLTAALALGALGASAMAAPLVAAGNPRPIIGIMAQPVEMSASTPKGVRSYIAASYVKYVESAGARAVPILYTSDKATLLTMFAGVNGLLFPGGAASLKNDSAYYVAGETLFNAAIAANKKGDHFPIWGTCLGFEQVARYLSGSNDDVLTAGFDSEDYPVALVPANPAALTHSKIFADASPALLAAITSLNITMNNHHSGVTPANFEKHLADRGVTMVSTNLDRGGKAFVSTLESSLYPVYASQWHPEKNNFEWTPKEAIPHSAAAVAVSQHTANFLVSEARKSAHTFPADQEQALLIYNYSPMFSGKAGSGFEQEYLFQ